MFTPLNQIIVPEENTRVDNWIASAKNHKFLSILIFGAIVFAGIASVTDSYSKLKIFIADQKAEIDPCDNENPKELALKDWLNCQKRRD